MAIVKILKIKSKAGITQAVNYVADKEKTAIENVVDYAAGKTNLVTGINCSAENAAEEMKANTDYWKAQRNTGDESRDAFHIIQSFDPHDDLTPLKCHEIGIKFAESLQHLDDKVEDPNRNYKMLVCTHTDKGHLHNHIILNSYDVTNGRMFHETPKVYQMMRDSSDKLCREYGLSVIEKPDNDRKRSYGEWQAARNGTSWKDDIRKDIRAFAEISKDWPEYRRKMEKVGYKIREGNYVTYTDMDGNKVKDTTLGKEYTKENLENYWSRDREVSLEESLMTSRTERFFADDKKLQKDALKKLEENNYYIGEPHTVLEMMLMLVIELLGYEEDVSSQPSRKMKAEYTREARIDKVKGAIEKAKELHIPNEDALNKEIKRSGTAIRTKKTEIAKITKTLEKSSELREALDTYKELSGKENLTSDEQLKLKECKAKMYRSGCFSEEEVKSFEGRVDGWISRAKELQTELEEENAHYRELKNLSYTIGLAKTEGFISGTYYEEEKDIPEEKEKTEEIEL